MTNTICINPSMTAWTTMRLPEKQEHHAVPSEKHKSRFQTDLEITACPLAAAKPDLVLTT
jgi:hypothetical protein